MARMRTAPSSQVQPSPSTAELLKKLAILLIADADCDEEQLLALRVSKMAIDAAKIPPNRRYGPRGFYDNPKSQDFFDLLLDGFSARWFKAWIRMDRIAFWHIHDLIKADPIFQSTGNRPQRPVHYQLAAFLIRCGSTSHLKSATVMSVSEGSIYNYMYRVGRALRNIRVDHLAWPGENRREFLSAKMEEWGFPGCLGSGDGSYIKLADKPGRNGFAYYCRKKFYALIIQATVDHRGIFTSYEFGWPGSVQDSKVFKNSHLWKHRDEYFRPHEYILVDKGYPLTQFSIRPFNDVDLTSKPEEAAVRRRWNRKLSALRIFVEHAFGRLKGRFPLLRCLPGRHIPVLCRLIEALMIVHNILEELGDDPKTISGFNGEEDGGTDTFYDDADPYLGGLDSNALHAAGVYRRKLLVDLMLRNEC